MPPVTHTHALFAEQSQSILDNLMEIIGRLCAVPKSRAMPPGCLPGLRRPRNPHRFRKRRDETIGEWRRGTASLRAPPGRRLTVEGFVVSGLLGMLLAQLVSPPRSADSGAVKRERPQRGRIDPKQPLLQPPFSDASVSNRTSFSVTYEILGSAANRIRSQRDLSKHCSVEDLALRC